MTRTSRKKLAANRKNAQKSTGPRSDRGKAYSRLNAVKHGLTARDLFPNPGYDRDELYRYEHLRMRLIAEWRLVGVTEYALVAQIANCLVRDSRAKTFERGQRRRRTTEAEALHGNARYEEMERDVATIERAAYRMGDCPCASKDKASQQASTGFCDGYRAAQARLTRNPFGIRYILSQLRLLRVVVERGILTPTCTIGIVSLLSGCVADPVRILIMTLGRHSAGSGCPGNVTISHEEEESVLSAIDSAIQYFDEVHTEIVAAEAHLLMGALDCAVLPDDAAIGTLVRYETTNNRTLHRTIQALRTLQKARAEGGSKQTYCS